MQRAVLTQWAQAAQEIGAMSTDQYCELADAADRTRSMPGRSQHRVGHTDVFARPTASR